MIVHNVDQTITSISFLDYVCKFAVMVKDTLHNVMMAIISMVRDVAVIARLKSDILVLVDLSIPKMLALCIDHSLWILVLQVKVICSVLLWSMSNLIIFLYS
jgi:hypothetical protein